MPRQEDTHELRTAGDAMRLNKRKKKERRGGRRAVAVVQDRDFITWIE